MSAAHIVMDTILSNGGDKLYQGYIQDKLLLYSAAKARTTCDALYSYINLTKDQEPKDPETFAMQWTDDNEPLPAEKPLWMGGNTQKLKKPAIPAESDSNTAGGGSTRRKRNGTNSKR